MSEILKNQSAAAPLPEIHEEMDEATLQEIEQRVREDMGKIESLALADEQTKKQLLVPYQKKLDEIQLLREQRERKIGIDALRTHLKTVEGMRKGIKGQLAAALREDLKRNDVKLETRRKKLDDINDIQLPVEAKTRLKSAGFKTIGDLLDADTKKLKVFRHEYGEERTRRWDMELIMIATALTNEGVNEEAIMGMLQRAALAYIPLHDWKNRKEDLDEEDDEVPEELMERSLYGNEDSTLDLRIGKRAGDVLRQNEISTVKKALSMSEKDWQNIKGLRWDTRNEIANRLFDIGVPKSKLQNIARI